MTDMKHSLGEERPRGPIATATYRWFVIVSLLFILPFEPLTNLVIPWIGDAVLGIEGEFSTQRGGSGDTMAEYVRLLLHVALGLVGAALWTGFGRSRVRYVKLHHWFTFAVRFAVAVSMLGYGAAKLIGGQFSSPDDIRLLQTFGDASPMGLMWAFMGHSKVYSAFTGLAEILGGSLLLSRRTTTLGALVVAGVMSNVVMLNFCYDVPVKLYSMRLLAWAVFLVALDGKRLFAVFANVGPTQPRVLPRLLAGRRAHLAGQAGKALIGLSLLLTAAFAPMFMERGDASTTGSILGTYEVVSYQQGGVEVPALASDDERWHRVVIATHDRFVVYAASGDRSFSRTTIDEDAGTLELTSGGSEGEPEVSTFEIERVDGGIRLVSDDRTVELAPFEPEFTLRERGFHWVQESPYNR